MTDINIPGLGTFDSDDIQCAGNCYLGAGDLRIVVVFKNGGFLNAPTGSEGALKKLVKWADFGASSQHKGSLPSQEVVNAYRFVTTLRLINSDGIPFVLWIGVNKHGAYTVELHSGVDEELLQEMSSRAHRATEESRDAESTGTPQPSVERAPEGNSLARKPV